jgi:hypothetical protein
MSEHRHFWHEVYVDSEDDRNANYLSLWACRCGAELFPHDILAILNDEATVEEILAERG